MAIQETLIKAAKTVLTMDDSRRELSESDILLRNGVIAAIGPNLSTGGQVILANDCVVTPGLVNTHHHFFQSLFRAVPGAQDHGLFDWLVRLFPIYGEITDEAVHISTLTALAEMILSGCTTSSDHLYVFTNDVSLDAQMRAAEEIGIRMHATRGSMSLGRSQGGLPPDNIVQTDDQILNDCQRVITAFHDP